MVMGAVVLHGLGAAIDVPTMLSFYSSNARKNCLG
jgi:hypothetical protein